MIVTSNEVSNEVHEVVKQFFDRHKDTLVTYGDAMGWVNEAEYETMRNEAGTLGRSAFTTEIVWLTCMFGPTATIDFAALSPKSRKLIPDIQEDEPIAVDTAVVTQKRRGRKPKPKSMVSKPSVVIVEDEEIESVATISVVTQPTIKTKPRRRAGRIPPGAMAEETQ